MGQNESSEIPGPYMAKQPGKKDNSRQYAPELRQNQHGVRQNQNESQPRQSGGNFEIGQGMSFFCFTYISHQTKFIFYTLLFIFLFFFCFFE